MNKEFINKYMEETKEIAQNIDREEINKFIEILFEVWKKGKKVITMGNGGSASTASHFTGDLLKTVANDSSQKEIRNVKGFESICLNDNQSALTAWINDSGWEDAYAGLLNTLLEEDDVILIISVHGGSGWSGNVVKAMDLAKKKNAKILGLAGFDGGKMKEICDSCLVVPKDSTPHVEGFHGVLQHCIIFGLKKLIEEHEKENSVQSTLGMKFFADTASLDEIEYSFSKGVNDGITTNPKIIESTGDLSRGFVEACRALVNKYPNSPISLETDLRGVNMNDFESQNDFFIKKILLKQAYELAKLGKNVVIKIPMCGGGLLAAKELAEKGIKTNITACMTPHQAMKAAQYGKGYVSMFANRILDVHILEMAGYNLKEILKEPIWKERVKQHKEEYFERAWEITLKEIAYVAKRMGETECELIIGSIRSPEDIYRIASAKPQIITIPTKIVEKLENIEKIKDIERHIKEEIMSGDSINHPMTTYTLKEFEDAADIYRKN